MFTLYEQYSDSSVMAAEYSSVIYAEPEVNLTTNAKGTYLFTSIDAPPSWSSPIKAKLPYFYSPESLYWFSGMENWSLSTGWYQFPPKLPPSLKSVHLFARRNPVDRFRYLGIGSISGYGWPAADQRCFLITDSCANSATFVTIKGWKVNTLIGL